jgi:hypothetical protein
MKIATLFFEGLGLNLRLMEMAVLTWGLLQVLNSKEERDKPLEFDFDSIREFIFKLAYSLTLD